MVFKVTVEQLIELEGQYMSKLKEYSEDIRKAFVDDIDIKSLPFYSEYRDLERDHNNIRKILLQLSEMARSSIQV